MFNADIFVAQSKGGRVSPCTSVNEVIIVDRHLQLKLTLEIRVTSSYFLLTVTQKIANNNTIHNAPNEMR